MACLAYFGKYELVNMLLSQWCFYIWNRQKIMEKLQIAIENLEPENEWRHVSKRDNSK